MLKKLDKSNFIDEINANITLVDFYADWCGPCKMIAPIIEEIANERTDITVGKVNVDNDAEIAIKYGVSSIPTLIVFKDGKETDRVVGFRQKGDILAML
ncbi:MAG: thioredoxin [Clostridia bacterium]|nr:thioredoxin [Clostridia bacterium]